VDSLWVFLFSCRVFANNQVLGNTRHDVRGTSHQGGVRNCQFGKDLHCAKPGSPWSGDVLPGSKLVTRGCGDVVARNRRRSVASRLARRYWYAIRNGGIGKVPTSPRPPLYPHVGLVYETTP